MSSNWREKSDKKGGKGRDNFWKNEMGNYMQNKIKIAEKKRERASIK